MLRDPLYWMTCVMLIVAVSIPDVDATIVEVFADWRFWLRAADVLLAVAAIWNKIYERT